MEQQGMKLGVRASAQAGEQQRVHVQRARVGSRPENSDRQNGQKRETQQRVIQNVSIGRNLRRLRRQRDLTQDQVASKLQVMGLPVTRGIYAQIETGAHHIPITWLMGLKRIFRTTYDEMLETEETMAFLRELE